MPVSPSPRSHARKSTRHSTSNTIMLEPEYTIEGSWKHLTCCEHNWHVRPGIWAVCALPEQKRERKEWLYYSAFAFWHLSKMDCVCAKQVYSILKRDFDTWPQYQLIGISHSLAFCSANMPEIESGIIHEQTCSAMWLLRQLANFNRGMISHPEIGWRFADFAEESYRAYLSRSEKSELRTRWQLRSDFAVQLLHDLFGNPFHPIDLSPTWMTHNGGAVSRLAQSIYQDRSFEKMPLLADTLENAGCKDHEILTHCREATMHVRGCWVLDLLLGK
jgi:hypothetical protein